MTTALQRAEPDADQLALMRRTLCPDLTADEFELFAAQCRRTGLDPFSRQIHAQKRKSRRQGTDTLTIQVGIDGLRLIAARTGELDGQDGPYWCGPDGVWRDVWLSPQNPAAAKVLVYRRGCSRPFAGIARWAEFAQAYPDGNPMGLWGKLPATMLAKCAEAAALRKAFPQELSGLYSDDEMGQADNPEPAALPAGKPEPRQIAAPAQRPAALPPSKLLDGATVVSVSEPVTEGDPATDAKAAAALAARKALAWPQVIANLNKRFGAQYGALTRWMEIPREHRQAVVDGLNRLCDATPDAVFRLLEEWAGLEGKTTQALFPELLHAIKCDAGCLDDLNTQQLAAAGRRIAERIAEHKQPKGG